MQLGDLVRWSFASKQDYLDYSKPQIGIFLHEIETYDHWILAEILDSQCRSRIVMLQKEINPL